MEGSIITCIEGPRYIESVTRASSWVAESIEAPIIFLHINEEHSDFAENRAELLFKRANSYIDSRFKNQISTLMLNGDLFDNIIKIQGGTRLLVVGKHGSFSKEQEIGSHVEKIIQLSTHPILMVPDVFNVPKNAMIAFDGKEPTVNAIETIAKSSLFKNIECHVVMVGADTNEHNEQLEWARAALCNAGIEVSVSLLVETSIENALSDYATRNQIDLLVMSAYKHSKLWHYLLGSNTSKLLHRSNTTTLILK